MTASSFPAGAAGTRAARTSGWRSVAMREGTRGGLVLGARVVVLAFLGLSPVRHTLSSARLR